MKAKSKHIPNVYISGTGSYVPETIVPNQWFERIGSSDAWIYEKLGIRERRVVTHETTSDLAAEAGRRAIANAGLSITDIELILVATATPDRQAPSVRLFCAGKLNAVNTVAFDVAAVCSGALFTISVGVQYIKSGMFRNVLVIGADTFSKITDWDRRDAVFLAMVPVHSCSQPLTKTRVSSTLCCTPTAKAKKASAFPQEVLKCLPRTTPSIKSCTPSGWMARPFSTQLSGLCPKRSKRY